MKDDDQQKRWSKDGGQETAELLQLGRSKSYDWLQGSVYERWLAILTTVPSGRRRLSIPLRVTASRRRIVRHSIT